MSVSVILESNKVGEIKSFLENFYDNNIDMENDVDRWIYVHQKPLDVIDMISVVMDNHDKYNLSLCIQIGEGDNYIVTHENYDDIIKTLLFLFYKE